MSDLADRVLNEVKAFFVASHDFNGITGSALQGRLNLDWDELTQGIQSLVKEGKVVLAFASWQQNPHILRLVPPDIPDQLRLLEGENPTTFGLYPTARVLLGRTDLASFDNRPFGRRLALGEPQLTPAFFELRVLDPYYRDPRYDFDFRDYEGKLSIHDESYRSSDTPERDKILLQSFGIAYDSKRRRVVVVYLRYLADLTPEHQAIWASHLVNEDCKVNSDYRDATLYGAWPQHHSAYSALLAEMEEINTLSKLMGKPALFRKTWGEVRPAGFHPMLRPNQRSYDEFVQLLDKLLSENIDRDFFAGDLSLEDEQERADGRIVVSPLGTLTLLERWLSGRYRTSAGQDVASEVVAPLKTVRKLRQGPAHVLTADAYDETFPGQQDIMVGDVVHGLAKLRLVLSSHPRARSSYTAPDWLDGENIVFY